MPSLPVDSFLDTVTKWLEGDPSNSFFEFKLAPWDQSGSDPLKGTPTHAADALEEE